jgi:hypothetical protein
MIRSDLLKTLETARASLTAAERDGATLDAERAAALQRHEEAAAAYADNPTEASGTAALRARDVRDLAVLRAVAAEKRTAAAREAVTTAQSEIDAFDITERRRDGRAAIAGLERKAQAARTALAGAEETAARRRLTAALAPVLATLAASEADAASKLGAAEDKARAAVQVLESARDGLAEIDPDFAAELGKVRADECAELGKARRETAATLASAPGFVAELAPAVALLAAARDLCGKAIAAIDRTCAEHIEAAQVAAIDPAFPTPRAVAFTLARLAILDTPRAPAEDEVEPGLHGWLGRDRDRGARLEAFFATTGHGRGLEKMSPEEAFAALLDGNATAFCELTEAQKQAEIESRARAATEKAREHVTANGTAAAHFTLTRRAADELRMLRNRYPDAAQRIRAAELVTTIRAAVLAFWPSVGHDGRIPGLPKDVVIPDAPKTRAEGNGTAQRRIASWLNLPEADIPNDLELIAAAKEKRGPLATIET